MSSDRDFWSRRKAAVAAEQEAEQRAVVAQSEADVLAEREARSDPEILAELDLPDPDDLQAGDDITGFMSKAVPERLRQRALRRLWRLNPVLANVDGLVDYGEDFTDAAVIMDGMQTTYQVGKGMLAHVQEMARQAEAEKDGDRKDGENDGDAATAESAAPPEPDGETEPAIEPAIVVAESEPASPAAPESAAAGRSEPAAGEDAAPARPKRMRFEFGADASNVKLTTGNA